MNDRTIPNDATTPSTETAEAALCFSGLNGSTGGYGIAPLPITELTGRIIGERRPPNFDELAEKAEAAASKGIGPLWGVDPKNLAQAGWGILFAHDADPAVVEALAPLIEHRRQQAGERFQLYDGREGYVVGSDERSVDWIVRHGGEPGPVDPNAIPYYLLIVGSPEAVPYRFQYQLDVQHAVGRVDFDAVEDYARYAAGVVAAESGGFTLPRRAAFFGVVNDDDAETLQARQRLIDPLHASVAGHPKSAGWALDSVPIGAATKSRLAGLLGGDATPALLFTSSHGLEFDADDPRLLPHQGALVCDEWPGRLAWGMRALDAEHYFAGDDLAAAAQPRGLIAFFFACFGAGTPRENNFPLRRRGVDRLAPRAFGSALPKHLLAHPRGGALAVVGHVDRAWSYAFHWPSATAPNTSHIAVYLDALIQLLDGYPLGHALDSLNLRGAELSVNLVAEIEDVNQGKPPDPGRLMRYWTANNDARNFAIVGDPAVRLCVDRGPG